MAEALSSASCGVSGTSMAPTLTAPMPPGNLLEISVSGLSLASSETKHGACLLDFKHDSPGTWMPPPYSWAAIADTQEPFGGFVCLFLLFPHERMGKRQMRSKNWGLGPTLFFRMSICVPVCLEWAQQFMGRDAWAALCFSCACPWISSQPCAGKRLLPHSLLEI